MVYAKAYWVDPVESAFFDLRNLTDFEASTGRLSHQVT